MATSFIRNGLTQVEQFSNYKLPKIFTKLVLMFSPLIKDNLIKHEFVIEDFGSLDTFRTYIDGVLHDEQF
jgi:hypothetical protein